MAYSFVGDNLQTTTISNLRDICLPESMKPYVSDINFILGTSYVAKTAISVCSFKDYLKVSFSREFVETFSTVSLFINLFTNNKVLWSVIVLIGLIYVWVLIRHTIISKRIFCYFNFIPLLSDI